MKNTKFTALWVLMFASYAGSLMAPPFEGFKPTSSTSKSTKAKELKQEQDLSGDFQVRVDQINGSASPTQPTLRQRAYEAASAAQKSMGNTAVAARYQVQQGVNAVGKAASYAGQQMGEGLSFAGQKIGQELNFVDVQAQNLGTQLGVPNLTGRSRDVTNINPNVRTTIGDRFTPGAIKYDAVANNSLGTSSRYNKEVSNKVETFDQNGQEVTTTYNYKDGSREVFNKAGDTLITGANGQEMYTPGNTIFNLPARATSEIAANLYAKFTAAISPENRQTFVDSVNSSIQSLGSSITATPAQVRSATSAFFKSITPNMPEVNFTAGFNRLMENLGVRKKAEVDARIANPEGKYMANDGSGNYMIVDSNGNWIKYTSDGRLKLGGGSAMSEINTFGEYSHQFNLPEGYTRVIEPAAEAIVAQPRSEQASQNLNNLEALVEFN